MSWRESDAPLRRHGAGHRARAADGYCLALGLDRGRLVEELLRQSKLRAYGRMTRGRDAVICASGQGASTP